MNGSTIPNNCESCGGPVGSQWWTIDLRFTRNPLLPVDGVGPVDAQIRVCDRCVDGPTTLDMGDLLKGLRRAALGA